MTGIELNTEFTDTGWQCANNKARCCRVNALHRHTHTLPSTPRSGGQWVRECLLKEAVVDLWKQGKEFPKQTSLSTLSCERDQNDASGNHRTLTTNKNIWERGKEIRLDKDRGITKGLVHQWSNEMKPYRVWGSGLDQTPHLNAGHFCHYCYSWNRTKKWLCTHDTPTWIPLETTMRLWGAGSPMLYRWGQKQVTCDLLMWFHLCCQIQETWVLCSFMRR